MEKLIITAAICGAEVTKEQNPNVPYTVEEIVREAKSAVDAGAAIIHLHVREDDGTPTQSHVRFQECTEAILKVCPNVILISPSESIHNINPINPTSKTIISITNQVLSQCSGPDFLYSQKTAKILQKSAKILQKAQYYFPIRK